MQAPCTVRVEAFAIGDHMMIDGILKMLTLTSNCTDGLSSR